MIFSFPMACVLATNPAFWAFAFDVMQRETLRTWGLQ